jgi:hypothetical protein
MPGGIIDPVSSVTAGPAASAGLAHFDVGQRAAFRAVSTEMTAFVAFLERLAQQA